MSANGIQLSLFIGPAPVAAPREVVEALHSVKVESANGDTPSGFELTFDLPKKSLLRTLFLLTGGGGGVPLMRVFLAVTLGGSTEPIVDGVVTTVDTVPGTGGVGQLVVRGKDLSALMHVIELPGVPYPAMPPSAPSSIGSPPGSSRPKAPMATSALICPRKGGAPGMSGRTNTT